MFSYETASTCFQNSLLYQINDEENEQARIIEGSYEIKKKAFEAWQYCNQS